MKSINIFLMLVCFVVSGVAQTIPQGSYLKNENATKDDVVTTYRDSFVICRNGDSVFIAKKVGNTIADAQYNRSLTSLKADGSMSYDKNNGFVYYSKNGNIYAAKEKSFGKFKSGKKQWIPGLGKERNEFKGSMLAYASWRYMPDPEAVVKNPTISQDGKTIYFATDAEGSKGWDIWTTTKNNDGEWSIAERLGKDINSPADEDFPIVIEDSLLAFASNRKKNVTPPDSGKFHTYVGMVDTGKRPIPYSKYAENNSFPADTLIADNKANSGEKEFVYDDEELPKTENERLLELMDKEPVMEPTKRVSASSINDAFAQNQDTVLRVSKNVIATVDKRIFYFDYDTDVLNGNHEKDIEVIIEFINFYPDKSFLIVGHTDERGTYEYNDALSLKRARKVESILVSKGISRKRLFTMGLGEYKPVYKNATTEEQHQKNRRVEILKMD